MCVNVWNMGGVCGVCGTWEASVGVCVKVWNMGGVCGNVGIYGWVCGSWEVNLCGRMWNMGGLRVRVCGEENINQAFTHRVKYKRGKLNGDIL